MIVSGDLELIHFLLKEIYLRIHYLIIKQLICIKSKWQTVKVSSLKFKRKLNLK